MKAHSPKASRAHYATIPDRPRANLRLARGAGTASRNSTPRSRAWRPFNKLPSRSRALAPRTDFRLVRGVRPPDGFPPRSRGSAPGRVSASLKGFGPSSESPPCSRPPYTSGASNVLPVRAFNALTPRGRPGQRRIPATPIP
jgi:hypothetical protein